MTRSRNSRSSSQSAKPSSSANKAEPQDKFELEQEQQREFTGTEPAELEVTAKEEPLEEIKDISVTEVQKKVRERLSRRSDRENIFVPSNPPELEREAKAIAEEMNFPINRGTLIGARLIAQSRRNQR